MKFALGSDHGGFELKEEIKRVLEAQEYHVTDTGCYSSESVDYPVFALNVCGMVTEGSVDRGILVCGTGIGMSMAANRFNGIRAALCHDMFTALKSREHNNANVLCLGGRIIGVELALEIVRTWIETPFEGGRHMRRLAMLDQAGGA